MSERKVLNKYYPPDFDPNKIPKLRRSRNRQFSIRIMAPFNMRCGTCGEYIYKGKKFNSRQEKVENEDYLGLMIFRFYIKCPRCVSEISFKTDPQTTDYELEAGATRNFEALRTAERLAEKEVKDKEDEEKDNPMKVLENRTKASRQEMEMLETLEELRELNSRQATVDHASMITLHRAYEEQLKKLQDDEDENFVKSIFGKDGKGLVVKRLHDDSEDEDDDTSSSAASTPKYPRFTKPSDILVQEPGISMRPPEKVTEKPTSSDQATADPASSSSDTSRPPATASWSRSVGGPSSKKLLAGLVRAKPKAKPAESTITSSGSTNLTKPSDILVQEPGISMRPPEKVTEKPTSSDQATAASSSNTSRPPAAASWSRSVGVSSKNYLAGLVRAKPKAKPAESTITAAVPETSRHSKQN